MLLDDRDLERIVAGKDLLDSARSTIRRADSTLDSWTTAARAVTAASNNASDRIDRLAKILLGDR
jgi:hypothetical protein